MKNILHDFEIRHKLLDERSLEHIRRGSRFFNEESPYGPGRNELIDFRDLCLYWLRPANGEAQDVE